MHVRICFLVSTASIYSLDTWIKSSAFKAGFYRRWVSHDVNDTWINKYSTNRNCWAYPFSGRAWINKIISHSLRTYRVPAAGWRQLSLSFVIRKTLVQVVVTRYYEWFSICELINLSYFPLRHDATLGAWGYWCVYIVGEQRPLRINSPCSLVVYFILWINDVKENNWRLMNATLALNIHHDIVDWLIL